MRTIWENEEFFIKQHNSKLPWVKLFTKKEYKELTQIPPTTRAKLYNLIENIELLMIEFYKPDKINIASFGNMLPHMHWHIIARFKNDPYFPKTTWEEPIREFNLKLPPFNEFEKTLKFHLNNNA
jgi:diadenosine tetraphosphate (Ap4A) HIT family hydrolase